MLESIGVQVSIHEMEEKGPHDMPPLRVALIRTCQRSLPGLGLS